MSGHASVAKTELGIDLPAHEETYVGFIKLTENLSLHVINIVLMLVLWGVEGHGFLAFLFFILNIVASIVGFVTGTSWRPVAVVFVLLGLACIVL